MNEPDLFCLSCPDLVPALGVAVPRLQRDLGLYLGTVPACPSSTSIKGPYPATSQVAVLTECLPEPITVCPLCPPLRLCFLRQPGRFVPSPVRSLH